MLQLLLGVVYCWFVLMRMLFMNFVMSVLWKEKELIQEFFLFDCNIMCQKVLLYCSSQTCVSS